jgi:hypothetical protein
MKNRIKALIVTLTVILFTGCYDRDIIDHKEFNHSLPQVESLNCTKSGEAVRLTWQIPANVSADFRRPLEVSVQVVEDNIYRQIVVVENENTSVDIPIDVSKKYRFVVKLLGYLTPEAQERGKPDRIYSDGRTVEMQ